MSVNIKKMITEEIHRYLINENIVELDQHGRNIHDKVSALVATVDALNDKNITAAVDKTLIYYFIQIIHAVNRCSKKESLKESLNEYYYNYGINLPPVLGGNVWQYMKQGYYNGKNFANGMFGIQNNYQGQGGINRYYNMTLESVKLGVLLGMVKNKETERDTLYSRYPALAKNPQIKEQVNAVFAEIYKLIGTYQELERKLKST